MDERLSVELIEALANIWRSIREKHPEVPGVVILAAPAPREQPRTMGHFAALRWSVKRDAERLVHEVVVTAEYLDHPPEETLDTLLHEAAHALNFARGKRDCSKSQYHNAHFKAAAEEIGLTVKQVPHYGFGHTLLPPETALRYGPELERLRTVLMHRRRPQRTSPVPTGPGVVSPETTAPPTGPSSRAMKATCSCGYIIRVSRKVLANTVVRCDSCGQPFAFTQ